MLTKNCFFPFRSLLFFCSQNDVTLNRQNLKVFSIMIKSLQGFCFFLLTVQRHTAEGGSDTLFGLGNKKITSGPSTKTPVP